MIMIVEDHKDVGEILECVLQYAGYQTLWVSGGAVALAMLHICKPSLIVLDAQMPDMDGLSVLRSIRGNAEMKDTRVVMYSAQNDPATVLQAKRLGALDFLLKGTGFDELVERIGELSGEPTPTHAPSLCK